MPIEDADPACCPPAYLSRLVRVSLPVLAMLTALLLAPVARAQGSMESVLSPGPLIEGHAKLEGDCSQCHVRFDRKAQDKLCLDCHKEVAADVRGKAGLHGHLQERQTCRSCHTDHKGRTAKTSSFDTKKFDHRQTDFQLRGRHQQVACTSCHTAGRKYREAPRECVECHRKDDVHKGSLGARCADCHAEDDWKKARFDHAKTRFPLTGRHVDTTCADCHKDTRFKETPRECYACHRADDDRKGHKGQFGQKCESCHATKAWKPSGFDHDRDAKYALRGRHAAAACASCHKGPLFTSKLSQECYACHKGDDKHNGTLGRDCGSCHAERSWKEPPRFDHGATSFPLLGAHEKVECKACHKSALFKEAPKDCVGCHRKDDKHAGTLGSACADCHSERKWAETRARFDHDKTRLPLRNAHAEARCATCHRDAQSFRNTPTDCYACHRKDDKHEGQEGTKCETCHGDKSWKVTRFDHATARFPLTGRHQQVPCNDCHKSSRFRDAPGACVACHRKDDRHAQRLGERCESCHNTRAWGLWTFDHGNTAFSLEGAHRKARCESCHQRPAPVGKNAAPVSVACVSCHASDDVHGGQFGARCEQCHASENWKTVKGRAGFADQRLRQGGKGTP